MSKSRQTGTANAPASGPGSGVAPNVAVPKHPEGLPKVSEVADDLHHIQTQARNQLKAAYSKINQQLDRLMGPELKKCIDQNKDDPVKITHCYDEFQRRVQPVLLKVKEKTVQSNEVLKKCLQSKQTAKQCAKVGIDKTQGFLNEAFNDLKSYLS